MQSPLFSSKQEYTLSDDQQHEAQERDCQQNMVRNDNSMEPGQQENYRTSINQLISEPIHENMYSMEFVYQSLYQLSDYLWNKRFYSRYGQGLEEDIDEKEVSFDQYLKPIQDELTKYDKFKRNKAKEEEHYSNLTKENTLKSHPTADNANTTIPVSHPHTSKLVIPAGSLQSQLIKCYQQVPFIYFQQPFSLNFSSFQGNGKSSIPSTKNLQKMRDEQQRMNDYLDLIEINLFGQIHRKFQDYFRAAANFDYLKESIALQLTKLRQARKRVARVQVEFVDKSQRLRQKIVQRNNYQKLIKKAKILKSLRKLPSIIQTILQSSLPYQCLQLLKTTKKSTSQVTQLTCVSSILKNIKSSETIVQLGLNKRYTDQLYLYVEEAFTSIDFMEQFRKATGDCPVIDPKEHENSVSVNSRRSEVSFRANDRSGYFLLEDVNEGKSNNLMKNLFAKRQEGKEYETAMILLQSYEYVDFPVDVTKIKLSNGLRVICRKFQKQLVLHIKHQLSKHPLISSSSILQPSRQSQPQRKSSFNAESLKIEEDSPEAIRQYIDRTSIEFYIKHIRVLNEMFKQSINRYLGYVLTLVTEYEQKLSKLIKDIDKGQPLNSKKSSSSQITDSRHSIEQSNSQHSIANQSETNLSDLSLQKSKSIEKSHKLCNLETTHSKFKQIFTEELSVLPSMFKIIQEKIKHFLTLKNISNATPQQFFSWVSLIRFWQRWFDLLGQESLLLNYTCTYLTSQTQISKQTQLLMLGQDMIGQLITIVLDNVKKSLTTMNLKNLITDLTLSYLDSYASTVNAQLYQAILDESWQSVQIPQEFSDVLNGILSKPSENQNMSLTILNSSSTQMSTSFSQQNNPHDLSFSSHFKYKILKNNILLQGQRYKLTVSFLLLCQFIEQWVRVGRLFEGITGETDEDSIKESKFIKRIITHVYDKVYELIDQYNSTTKEMILEKKALKMEKIKGNNITVKHICLLSNCLTFLEKLTQQIPQKQISVLLFPSKSSQTQTIRNLQNHNILLIDKISSILLKKIEQIVQAFKTKQQQKTFNIVTIHQFIVQSNQSIVTLFLQITQIIDEYLDVQKCQTILKQPFMMFVHKYFKTVILKGEKCVEEARILLQKMKFLKKYFKNEFVMLQRQVQD